MLLYRASNRKARGHQRRTPICGQHRVVRGEPRRAVRVLGQRRVGRGGRPLRVQHRPVVAHAEHVVGRSDGGTAVTHVHGVYAGGDEFGGPAPDPDGHRTAVAPCGRYARDDGVSHDGPAVVLLGRVPRGALHRGRVPVVRSQPGQLDVLRVLRVPIHRPSRFAVVRANRQEHRMSVRPCQRRDRA